MLCCNRMVTAALRMDGGNDVPRGGGGATVLVIDAIGVDNNLGAGDVLVLIDGIGAIGAICGGALGSGGDDSILGAGDVSMGGWCSCGGSGALAVGKGDLPTP
jgi:hypothetical protein